MILAIAIAIVPVGIGVLIALIPSLIPQIARGASPLFMVAAVLVAVLQLLPESAEAHGLIPAILLMLVAFALPALLEKLSKTRNLHVELTLTLIGFLIHQFSDGIQLGFATVAGAKLLSVGTALAIHTVPLTAIITERFAHRHNAKVAIGVGLSIGLASIIGVLTGQTIAIEIPHLDGWYQSIIAGLLLHVMWHTRNDNRKETN
jgi:cyanate permease